MNMQKVNHWSVKRYTKYCCKEHGPNYLAAGCQPCIDGFNKFMRGEMLRMDKIRKIQESIGQRN